MDESAIEISKRYLLVEGRPSPKAQSLVKGGLPEEHPYQSEIYFVSFAYATLPLGKTFEVVFPHGKPEAAIMATSRIVGITQQLLEPWEIIPYGWKTICLIQFPQGIPELMNNLPVVRQWHESKVEESVYLTSRETWEALKHQAQR